MNALSDLAIAMWKRCARVAVPSVESVEQMRPASIAIGTQRARSTLYGRTLDELHPIETRNELVPESGG